MEDDFATLTGVPQRLDVAEIPRYCFELESLENLEFGK